MGNHGKAEQPHQVLSPVMRIEAALRDEEPHDRGSQPADDMQTQNPPHRLKAGEEYPRQMVDCHGDDRNQL